MNEHLHDLFLIRPDITFLNFASFGSCPRPVFERYQQYQLELEQEPVRFMTALSPGYLKRSRQSLGAYLNCPEDDIVCVTNPSYGVNIVAKSLDLKSGDEILTSDLEYGACDRTWRFICKQTGAVYKRQKISFPVQSKEEIIEAIISGITNRTKIIFLSHITSSTSLRIPVEEICAIAREKGILTFIDGAHAPAQIDVDLIQMGCDFYTGACHKWMLAPKGSSFLYAQKNVQGLLDPLVVSWGYEGLHPSGSLFIDYHEMQGTRDLSAFCAIPDTIDFLNENDWKRISRECKQIVADNAVRFHDLLEAEHLYPQQHYFQLQMLSIPIATPDPQRLYQILVQEHQVQIPVMVHDDKVLLRYSYNACNRPDDLDRLYDVLQSLKSSGQIR